MGAGPPGRAPGEPQRLSVRVRADAGGGKRRTWSVPVDESGDEPAGVDGAALAGVLAAGRSEAWPGVTARRDKPWAGLDLWLITVPGQCMLTASHDAVDRGLVLPVQQQGTPALADGGSLAYQAVRLAGDERTVLELGACGHGLSAYEFMCRARYT